MKFKAYDKINNKKIDLYRITLSSDGSVLSVIDLQGEHYGTHQVRLTVTGDKKKAKIAKKKTMEDWVELVHYTKGDKLYYVDNVLHKMTPNNTEYYRTHDGKWKKYVTLKIKGMK